MHICFISSEYPLWKSGGVGSFLQTIGRAFVKYGHKITVVCTADIEKEVQLNDNGVIIYRLPQSKAYLGKFLFNTKQISNKINALHKELKIDIVESAELGLAFLGKNSSIKYIIRLHGGHHFFSESEKRSINWWQGFKEKLSFKKADGFIAVSQFVKDHTAKYLSYNNKPISIIYSPINTELFSPRTNVNSEPFNITFVGTICEKKGIRQLIMAMEIIAEKYPEVHLNVYGREWFYKDGRSYTHMLLNYYKDIIDNYVTFHGVVPFHELPEKYALSHVCVFPSHMETQGLVAQEAMAMEKPVVFTQLGPGKETIEDYYTGLLCNPYDINDIATKVIWVLDNQDKSQHMGINARSFVVKTFDIETSIDKNIKFYNDVIEA